MDTEVIGINRRSVFSLDEAKRLIHLIRKMTKQSAERVQMLINQMERLSRANDVERSRLEALEEEASQIIQDWQTKVQKLGGLPKGIWIVDVDSGDGYFCWKYPEITIEHWHRYSDGFTKRKSLNPLPGIQTQQDIMVSGAQRQSLNGANEIK